MTTLILSFALTFGFFAYSYAQKEKIPSTTVTTIINAPVDSCFNYIVPVDLTHIFKKYKIFPAIVKTNETEKWFKAGLTRTVFFEDGTSSNEMLLTVEQNQSFSYKIDNFTSQLRFLAKYIEGEWRFTSLDAESTKIEWTYKIYPKNFFTHGLIKLFLVNKVNGLLTNALSILKNDLETKN